MYKQEQLKVVGLMSSLQVEEEVAQREEQLNALLQDKKSLKVYTHVSPIHTYIYTSSNVQ